MHFVQGVNEPWFKGVIKGSNTCFAGWELKNCVLGSKETSFVRSKRFAWELYKGVEVGVILDESLYEPRFFFFEQVYFAFHSSGVSCKGVVAAYHAVAGDE